MGADFDHEWSDEWNETGDEADDFEMHDPLEGLTKGEQDIFFQVLDLVPDEQREATMDYFMDHPSKIRAVVANVKAKKELIKNHDQPGLQKIFQQEQIILDQLDQNKT